MKKIFIAAILLVLCSLSSASFASELKIAIMQDAYRDAQKYRPLVEYFKTKGIDASFSLAQNYPEAAKMFSLGTVNAMFSGSGIAGAMIIKDLAVPIVRPVDKDGISTYWAVVLAPKGTPAYNGQAGYFKGKKVILCALASSGEFYLRSIPGDAAGKATIVLAASHGAAIDGLSKGLADVAIVKNRTWDKVKHNYAGLEMVGKDTGENPDGTFIMSSKVDEKLKEQVEAVLLALEADSSTGAAAVKETMGIQGFIKTTMEDFKHTLGLLKKAGVNKSFDFAY
ncbi:MAG: hypothetical protein A2X56_04785 [Nitrospirae bacterium GWC2_57_13]|jgi:ABC-type phosphate/phosphonate transport system substrate-binding protein|nr:MAG: hypothetical protein A2X56_04785 [Nitrospirae bacterium GWC2_57_13]OGW43351.1 MAG: hypothetical protein A2X57_00030 [Nitrospirae bacterium GWD2_57_8]HAS54222.1 hypothetical protein [Nitrospiraceae bacterium]